ncbi:unnamed protein product [Discula destructiva]
MVDIEVSVETEEQFWEELQEILARTCDSHDTIDDSLRSWLHLVSTCRDNFLHDEDDVANCSQLLLNSPIFCGNQDYVRTQITYSLLQEEDPSALNVIANFLLLNGRSDETTFKAMIEEGCFPRLVELIKGRREDDRRLHRLLLELMYEMARIETLRADQLLCVDDDFVIYMLELIEHGSDDADDPYHYPIIRVLLVLNEQYMVTSTAVTADPSEPIVPLTNRVVKILSLFGPKFRTFGENIILLLNRETETSLQLLILKLLYLLFTTRATYEYFYTNDLRVLLDVIIRNLLDLPDESMSLRHTYLRVLSPLLAHTQLAHRPHYKRQEILKVLQILGGDGNNAHFAPADETTVRLVDRVSKVPWLLSDSGGGGGGGGDGEAEIAKKLLGISLSHAQTASSMSVVDIAGVMEKPGVKTPSRSRAGGGGAISAELKEALGAPGPTLSPDGEESGGGDSPGSASQMKQKKILPAVPKHRHGKPTTAPALLHVTSHNNGNGHSGGVPVPVKKLPPKTPPPRRTRLKVELTAEAAPSPPPPPPPPAVPVTTFPSAPG